MKKNILLQLTLIVCIIGLESCGKSKNNFDGSLIPADNGERKVYINSKGETVLTPNEDLNEIDFFYNDRALVSTSTGKGFIDKTGKIVIPCNYKKATHFTDGLAWVVETDGYPIAIDPSGKTVIEMPNALQVFSFVDGLAVFQDKKTSLFGIINGEGKEVIAPKHQNLMIVSPDFIAFRVESGLWGIMDKNEKIGIIPQFDAISSLSNKKYAVVTASGNKKGVVNMKGEYVIKPALKEIIPDGDLFLVQTSNDLFGWMNAKDQYVINPQYTIAYPFEGNDLAAVSIVPLEQSGITLQMGYINKKGEEKIRPQFEQATYFYNDVAMIRIGSKYGFINKEGSIVVNPQFKDIEFPVSFMATCRNTKSVYSDYFDHNAITSTFLDIPQDGTFRGFEKAATFAILKTKYGEKLVRRGGRSCRINEEIKLSDDASVTETTLNFEKDLESREYNYYTKEYETSTHNDAQLSSVNFKIEMKNNKDKRDALYNRIVDQLKAMPMISYGESCDYSCGDVFSEKMDISVNSGKSGIITVDIIFK